MPAPDCSTARDRALAFLHGRIDYERTPASSYGDRQFKLDRMRELLRRLGDPHRDLNIVHVAGTKGKGSTAAAIAAALSAAGQRTGLFTSPHLVDLEERIAVDAQRCTGDELVELVERLRDVVAGMDAEAARTGGHVGPTYFELTTAMALVHFATRRVQAAVLEVGLGGRLDATNVCLPRVAVITSISFDHTRQLGNTLAAIAGEKAGIVKPGVPLVCGVTEPEPQGVIEQICRQRDSRLVQLGRDFDYHYHAPRLADHYPDCGKIDFTWCGPPRLSYDGLSLGLLGRHQGTNAAVAMATLVELNAQGFAIDESAMRAGLLQARAPARVEIIERRPTVILDTAHNVASVAALIDTLEASFVARRRVLIFGTSIDKDARGMLARLAPAFDAVLLVRCRDNPRGMPVVELAAIAAELGATNCRVCDDVAVAWDATRALLTPEHLLCVTGSFYVAADMRREIERRPIDRTGAVVQTA